MNYDIICLRMGEGARISPPPSLGDSFGATPTARPNEYEKFHDYHKTIRHNTAGITVVYVF